MISLQYINEFKECDELDEFILQEESNIDSLMINYNIELDRYKAHLYVNESTADNTLVEEGALKVVEAIGKAVEKVIDKVKEMIQKGVEIFNEYIWNKKADAQKLEKILKAHPSIAEDIKFAVKKGDIEIKDIKSMQDLMDGTYDLLEKINKGSMDETKAEKAFDKIVHKFEKYGKPVIGIIAGATTVIVGVKTVSGLYPELMKNKMEGQKLKADLDQMKYQAQVDASGNGGTTVPNNFKTRMVTRVCGLLNRNISANNSLSSRFSNWMSTTLGRLNQTPAEKLQNARNRADMYSSVSNRGKENSAARERDAKTQHDINNAGRTARAKDQADLNAYANRSHSEQRTADAMAYRKAQQEQAGRDSTRHP